MSFRGTIKALQVLLLGVPFLGLSAIGMALTGVNKRGERVLWSQYGWRLCYLWAVQWCVGASDAARIAWLCIRLGPDGPRDRFFDA